MSFSDLNSLSRKLDDIIGKLEEMDKKLDRLEDFAPTVYVKHPPYVNPDMICCDCRKPVTGHENCCPHCGADYDPSPPLSGEEE
jgi:hypothetical protein